VSLLLSAVSYNLLLIITLLQYFKVLQTLCVLTVFHNLSGFLFHKFASVFCNNNIIINANFKFEIETEILPRWPQNARIMQLIDLKIYGAGDSHFNANSKGY